MLFNSSSFIGFKRYSLTPSEIAYKKAIARGEKPSVKMAIEEFQKQIKKEDQQKAWTKEHSKNKGTKSKETER